MAFQESVAALKTGVQALIAKYSPAAVTAAVNAAVATKDQQDAAVVDQLNLDVQAALK